MDLGQNICVGDVGASGYNFLRQVQIACQNALTPFVIHAESDCLYPPDYFTFTPPKLDIPYRNTNIYVQKYRKDYFCKKNNSTFSQIVGKDFYLKRLQELFGYQPIWNIQYKNFPKEIKKNLFDKFEYFNTKNSCISFKTGQGMRKHSNCDEIPVYKLPYWGDVRELRRNYEN